ncbi:peptidase M20A family protein [Abortiporus biennis]
MTMKNEYSLESLGCFSKLFGGKLGRRNSTRLDDEDDGNEVLRRTQQRQHKRTKSAPLLQTQSTHTSSSFDKDNDPISPGGTLGTLVEKDEQSLPPWKEKTSFDRSCTCCAGFDYTPTTRQNSLAQIDELKESDGETLFRPEVLQTIEETIDGESANLRKLSLDIWDHPEPAYAEHYAHNTLTSFIAKRGFTVTKHYLGLKTAWKAEFSHGKDGRVIGVNSEMDALPGLGHACGHNLIAISGVAIAIALKAALISHDIPGRIILLGTPAEETGGGKIQLLERGAYKDMDACIMSHPGPGPQSVSVTSFLALQHIEVEFFGHSAHAAFSPWEAQNALDAAFLAYSGVSVLRQQIRPTCRVHGIVTGKDWEPNVIPDYAKMRWIVRAPTWAEVEVLRKKILACFDAAGMATGCKVQIKLLDGYKDVRENRILGTEFCKIVQSRYGLDTLISDDVMPASTDFGNISYSLPSIHPAYAIPTEKNGSNHTPQFSQSAKLPEAHEACIKISKGLAMTGLRVLADQQFSDQVKEAFEEQQR